MNYLERKRQDIADRSWFEGEEVTLSPMQRLLSTFGSGALLALGRGRRSGAGLLTTAISGYLLYRGFTGRCPASEALGPALQATKRTLSQEKPIFVDKSIVVNKPAAELYRYWRRFDNLPRIMSHLKTVEVLSDKRSRWTATGPGGTSIEWEAEIVADEEGRRIAWRSTEAAQVPNTGSVEFREVAGDTGTEVRVRLQYHPPGGAIGAALARLFGEEPSQQIDDDLGNFKRKVETGEIVLAARQAQVPGRN